MGSYSYFMLKLSVIIIKLFVQSGDTKRGFLQCIDSIHPCPWHAVDIEARPVHPHNERGYEV